MPKGNRTGKRGAPPALPQELRKVKLTAHVDADVYRMLQRVGVGEGQSIGAVISRLLLPYVSEEDLMAESLPKIYTFTASGHTPLGTWKERGPVDYRHAANIAAQRIAEFRDADLEAEEAFTVWGGAAELLTVGREGVRLHDKDLATPEVRYIASAMRRALKERKAAKQA